MHPLKPTLFPCAHSYNAKNTLMISFLPKQPMNLLLIVVVFVCAFLVANPILAQSLLNDEYSRLQDQKMKATDAAVEPINRRYQVALENLLRKAIQSGDLKMANLIDRDLKSLSLKKAKTAASVSAFLIDTTWVWWPSHTIKFLSGGKVKWSENSVLWEWKVLSANNRVIEGRNKHKGTTFKITFDEYFKTGSIEESDCPARATQLAVE